MVDDRPYSPGLEGVLAGETALAYIDGAEGRLLYRGYSIRDLVHRGSYASVAELLWTDEWRPDARLPLEPVPDGVLAALRALPTDSKPMDALRTAVSAWGAAQNLSWPPTVEQARALTAFSPSALAAFARIRNGQEPVDPDPSLDTVPGFLYQLNGERVDDATARALDAYFVVGAEHGFNASTFTARVITSTRSDIASAVCGAIGALKGPLHGGAPSEVVEQLHEVGSVERAEQWVRETLARGERLMGFGHRVYRAYDPRAAALREVAECDGAPARLARPRHRCRGRRAQGPGREAPRPAAQDQRRVLRSARAEGVGLTPDLFPATFALARHAGWTAHILEQASANRLIRPDVRYIGPDERPLPE